MINDIDGTIKDMGLVQGRCTPIPKRVVSNSMGVEAEALKSNLGGMKVKELDNPRACDT